MKRNVLEWSVFSLGVALTLAIVGYLGFELATRRNGPTVVEVTLGSPERRGDVYLVPVVANNPSDETVEGVVLEAELTIGKDRETAQFELAFLPRRSQRVGWFTFGHDP